MSSPSEPAAQANPGTSEALTPAPAVTSSPSPSTSQVLPSDFKVYAPPNVQAAPLPSLSDDYFTPSAAELQAAQATLSARTNNMVNAPLQLRAVREQAEKAKRDRYPNTTIRVRFSDRTQLEKTFPSTDKIRSVYAFVRSCLREDVKPIKFILYQSPPKRDLKVSDPKVRDLTLAELHLAPASILLLRFENEEMDKTTYPAPLDASILANITELPIPKPEATSPPPAPAKDSTPKPKPSGSSSNGGEKKIPKWLKLGKK